MQQRCSNGERPSAVTKLAVVREGKLVAQHLPQSLGNRGSVAATVHGKSLAQSPDPASERAPSRNR